MGNTAKGKHALFISDRSGLQFPYTEMVREWNGSRVHTSEYEPKQPQLEPKPFTADPQGLMHPRPDRLELPTGDFLPINPIGPVENNVGITRSIMNVAQPNSGILVGDYVRLMKIQQPIPIPSPFNNSLSILDIELTATLGADITANDTTLTLTTGIGVPYIPTLIDGGFLMIEKINSTTGLYENEIIQYASRNALPGDTFYGLIRGTNAPFRGQTPNNTTASAHLSGARIFFARKVVALNTTTSPSGGQPSTVTNYNGYQLDFSSGTTVFPSAIGGGNGCIAGPLNVNITDGRS